MDKKFRKGLLDLTKIIETMDIVAIKHGVTYYYWVVKYFDITRQNEINKICSENNLVWNVKPEPEKITSGKSTSTGNKLTRLGYKRKPLSKGTLPKEIARAKIIVHAKKRVKRG